MESVQIYLLRLRALYNRARRGALSGLLLASGLVFLAPPVQAAPAGIGPTLYNGKLPTNTAPLCAEGRTCQVTGSREIWYGASERWAVKLVTGSFACNNDFFLDVMPYVPKNCFQRDATLPTVLPPPLTSIPVSFNLYDLLTADNGRYKLDVVANGQREKVLQNKVDKVLAALRIPGVDLSLPQAFFQFNITDTGVPGKPVQDYAVTFSSTQERCLVHHRINATTTEVSIGRIIEIYTLTARPEAQIIPYRSDIQKVCTNDKGQLAVHITAPSSDAFQMKIVTHGVEGRPNDLYELFIPTNFNWQQL